MNFTDSMAAYRISSTGESFGVEPYTRAQEHDMSPSNVATITINGIGTVLVNLDRGTLRPRTHVVGQRLGVGYSAGTTEQQERQRALRARVLKVAEAMDAREPEVIDGAEIPPGWRWLDHNGDDASIAA